MLYSLRGLSFAVLSLALILPFAAPTPQAQPSLDSLSWELVGETFRTRGLFAAGVDYDLAPAVYAIGDDGLFVIYPNEEDWTFIADFPTLDSDRDAFVSRVGTLFGIGRFGIERSPDGGESWVETLDHAYLAPVYTPADALITNLDGFPDYTLARSTDDGLTWTMIDMWPTLGGRILPLTFATLPVSEALANGRVIAGGNDAIVYSDDDGFSWEPTNVYAGFRYRITSIVRAPWGLLYAQVNDFATGDIGGVAESADGAVWTRVGQIPNANDTGAQVVAVGDSMLFAINLSENEDIQVYRSGDRGRTWAGTGRIAAEEAVGNPVRMRELIVGPEGRLWVGMTDSVPGPKGTGGVFRTVEPVVAVSAEGGPEPGKPVAELGAAYPNPSSGRTTVPLMLPEAADVSVAVFDVLGRSVATLHEGWLSAGTHRFAVEGWRLPVGVYFVRVEGSTGSITRRFVVAR